MGKLAIMPVAAVVVLLFAGVAQAWTCAPGYKDCDKNWPLNGCEVNINTDVNNCGNCGYKCGSLCGANVVPACKSAKCEFTCKPPFLNCDNNWTNGCEVDSSQDTNNCGACGCKCIAPPYATAKCYNGKCEYTCKPGWKNCDGKWENGCETDVGNDVNNCNGCGNKCVAAPNATPKCNNYKCVNTCKPTFADCDSNLLNGCETCTATDINNCGACGTKCVAPPNASAKCNGGKCVYTCKPGYFNCDGDWSNGCEGSCGSDVNNCGACGVKCSNYPNAVTSCNGGKCVYTCKPGYFNCDGDWSNGCEGACGSDVNNCGACGVKCGNYPNALTSCSGGQCQYSCKPGFANCDGKWENGCECVPGSDVNHCGGCGNKCPTPRYAGGEAKCTNGKCEQQSCKSGWTWESKKSCCVSGTGSGGGKTCILFLCF